MFPFNFVVGAAVGAAATYIYKDEPAKKRLGETGTKLKEGVSSFMASFRKKPEPEIEGMAEGVVEVVSEEVDAETIVANVEDSKQSNPT